MPDERWNESQWGAICLVVLKFCPGDSAINSRQFQLLNWIFLSAYLKVFRISFLLCSAMGHLKEGGQEVELGVARPQDAIRQVGRGEVRIGQVGPRQHGLRQVAGHQAGPLEIVPLR